MRPLRWLACLLAAVLLLPPGWRSNAPPQPVIQAAAKAGARLPAE